MHLVPNSYLPSDNLLNLIEQALDYASQSKSKNTQIAYAKDWACFDTWCYSKGLTSLPCLPQTLALYLTDKSSLLKVSSLQRRLVSIKQKHQEQGITLDLVSIQEIWRGIKRAKGTHQQGKSPLLNTDLKQIVRQLPSTPIAIRDKALLLLGFTGGFRRSELVSLHIEDLEFSAHGLLVHLKKSKTDQEGQGRQIGILYGAFKESCPIRSLQEWISILNRATGPLFCSINRHAQLSSNPLLDLEVARIVKKRVYESLIRQGYTDEDAKQECTKFSGHSLRSGLVTSAASAGLPEHMIMRQTGHKRSDTLRKYIRMGNVFTENVSGKLGL